MSEISWKMWEKGTLWKKCSNEGRFMIILYTLMNLRAKKIMYHTQIIIVDLHSMHLVWMLLLKKKLNRYNFHFSNFYITIDFDKNIPTPRKKKYFHHNPSYLDFLLMHHPYLASTIPRTANVRKWWSSSLIVMHLQVYVMVKI